ncbi:MAG: hypothetical protein HYZ53_28900 [Planctomycetes bacterium]|nr:hypothetical protein [Planctomycetota bacterium]
MDETGSRPEGGQGSPPAPPEASAPAASCAVPAPTPLTPTPTSPTAPSAPAPTAPAAETRIETSTPLLPTASDGGSTSDSSPVGSGPADRRTAGQTEPPAVAEGLSTNAAPEPAPAPAPPLSASSTPPPVPQPQAPSGAGAARTSAGPASPAGAVSFAQGPSTAPDPRVSAGQGLRSYLMMEGLLSGSEPGQPRALVTPPTADTSPPVPAAVVAPETLGRAADQATSSATRGQEPAPPVSARVAGAPASTAVRPLPTPARQQGPPPPPPQSLSTPTAAAPSAAPLAAAGLAPATSRPPAGSPDESNRPKAAQTTAPGPAPALQQVSEGSSATPNPASPPKTARAGRFPTPAPRLSPRPAQTPARPAAAPEPPVAAASTGSPAQPSAGTVAPPVERTLPRYLPAAAASGVPPAPAIAPGTKAGKPPLAAAPGLRIRPLPVLVVGVVLAAVGLVAWFFHSGPGSPSLPPGPGVGPAAPPAVVPPRQPLFPPDRGPDAKDPHKRGVAPTSSGRPGSAAPAATVAEEAEESPEAARIVDETQRRDKEDEKRWLETARRLLAEVEDPFAVALTLGPAKGGTVFQVYGRLPFPDGTPVEVSLAYQGRRIPLAQQVASSKKGYFRAVTGPLPTRLRVPAGVYTAEACFRRSQLGPETALASELKLPETCIRRHSAYVGDEAREPEEREALLEAELGCAAELQARIDRLTTALASAAKARTPDLEAWGETVTLWLSEASQFRGRFQELRETQFATRFLREEDELSTVLDAFETLGRTAGAEVFRKARRPVPEPFLDPTGAERLVLAQDFARELRGRLAAADAALRRMGGVPAWQSVARGARARTIALAHRSLAELFQTTGSFERQDARAGAEEFGPAGYRRWIFEWMSRVEDATHGDRGLEAAALPEGQRQEGPLLRKVLATLLELGKLVASKALAARGAPVDPELTPVSRMDPEKERAKLDQELARLAAAYGPPEE